MDKIPIPSYEATDLPSSVQRLSIYPGPALSNSSRVTRSTSIASFSSIKRDTLYIVSLVRMVAGISSVIHDVE